MQETGHVLWRESFWFFCPQWFAYFNTLAFWDRLSIHCVDLANQRNAVNCQKSMFPALTRAHACITHCAECWLNFTQSDFCDWRLKQMCPRVGLTRGSGWIRPGQLFLVTGGLRNRRLGLGDNFSLRRQGGLWQVGRVHKQAIWVKFRLLFKNTSIHLGH